MPCCVEQYCKSCKAVNGTSVNLLLPSGDSKHRSSYNDEKEEKQTKAHWNCAHVYCAEFALRVLHILQMKFLCCFWWNVRGGWCSLDRLGWQTHWQRGQTTTLFSTLATSATQLGSWWSGILSWNWSPPWLPKRPTWLPSVTTRGRTPIWHWIQHLEWIGRVTRISKRGPFVFIFTTESSWDGENRSSSHSK